MGIEIKYDSLDYYKVLGVSPETPEEELLEEQPAQTETEAGQTTPATEQQTQPAEEPTAAPETIPETPIELETPAIEQQEEGTENT